MVISPVSRSMSCHCSPSASPFRNPSPSVRSTNTCRRTSSSMARSRARTLSGSGASRRLPAVVVPAIGIVVCDDNSRGAPVRQLLQVIDGVHQKGLLIQRIGVAGVTVLVCRRLQVTHGGHLAGVGRGPEIGEVVLVVG